MNIAQILDKHGSDKHKKNGYGPLYQSLFGALHPAAMLEVGIGTMIQGAPSSMYGHDLPGYAPGASLRAWAEIFPNTRIVGVDTQADCMIEMWDQRGFYCDRCFADPDPRGPDACHACRINNHNRRRQIQTLQFDAYERAMVKSRLDHLGQPRMFGLIIDDGDHDPMTQRRVLENLWNNLVPGGMYVIEDVQRNAAQPNLITLVTVIHEIIRAKFEAPNGLNAAHGEHGSFFRTRFVKSDVLVINKFALPIP